MSKFKKAVKNESKLKMAIAGVSGSGKTFTSLTIATTLNPGSVAVIDTENGSAAKYAGSGEDGHSFEFDQVVLKDDFNPRRYVELIQDAISEGYKALVIDSLSHAWMGSGGILEMADNVAKRKKCNSFTAWKEITPIQNKFIEAIVQADINIIATMRSKQAYEVEKTDKGLDIKKLGLAPLQRDGVEYEFDILAEMDQENNMIITKTRCFDLAGRVINKPGKHVAEVIDSWLGGLPVEPAQMITKKQLDILNGYMKHPEATDKMKEYLADKMSSPVTKEMADRLIDQCATKLGEVQGGN